MKWSSYFFVTCLSMTNWLSNVYNNVKTSIKHFYQHITDYVYNRHITWVLPEGHTLFLPLSHINNQVPVKWTYSDHVLQCITSSKPVSYKLGWLSMKLAVNGSDEYDMDSFLQNFRIITDAQHPPHLNHIFLSWCAETKHWFSHSSMFHFMIVDEEGQERVLSIAHDNKTLRMIDNKIYDIAGNHHKKNDNHENANPYTFYHG